MTGADEFFDLARDFRTGGARMGVAMFGAFKAGGEVFAAEWKKNAKATSGKHGRHYPNSITSSPRLTMNGVTIETGPDSSKKQGRMGRGFEFGSEHQPPHLDGLHALPHAEEALDKLAEFAIEALLP